jgi:hypothetical protein
MSYQCILCENPIPHPESEDDCPSTEEGHCADLIGVGAVPIWARIYLQNHDRPERHIVTRGGWLCSTCTKEYSGKSKR